MKGNRQGFLSRFIRAQTNPLHRLCVPLGTKKKKTPMGRLFLFGAGGGTRTQTVLLLKLVCKKAPFRLPFPYFSILTEILDFGGTSEGCYPQTEYNSTRNRFINHKHIIAYFSAIDNTISEERGIAMKTRSHYEKLFASYPDVVTLPEFQTMLGGIGDSTARKIMRANKVKHFYIRCTYLIPKACVIDYVLSEDYAKYSKTLKARV